MRRKRRLKRKKKTAACAAVCAFELFLKCLEVRAGDLEILLYGASPSYSVLDNLLNVLVLEGLVSLVTGLEVEDSAVSACEGATASEYLAAVEPTHKDDILGIGNIEGLAVHLLGIENEGLVNSRSDGVIGLNCPDALSCAVSPLEITGGAAELAEYLGVVARMENYESHSAKYSLMYSLYYLIGYSVVCHVSPPDHNVGVVNYCLSKTALLVVKSSGANLDVVALKYACEVSVKTAGVELKYSGVCFFMTILVPNCNLHFYLLCEFKNSIQENYTTASAVCQEK